MYNVTVRYKGKRKFKPFLSSCPEAVFGPFCPAWATGLRYNGAAYQVPGTSKIITRAGGHRHTGETDKKIIRRQTHIQNSNQQIDI